MTDSRFKGMKVEPKTPPPETQQNCPICGSFLPASDKRDDGSFVCPKCGTEFG